MRACLASSIKLLTQCLLCMRIIYIYILCILSLWNFCFNYFIIHIIMLMFIVHEYSLSLEFLSNYFITCNYKYNGCDSSIMFLVKVLRALLIVVVSQLICICDAIRPRRREHARCITLRLHWKRSRLLL